MGMVSGYAQINPVSQEYQAVAGISNNEVLISSINTPPRILVAASGISYDTLHLEPHNTLNNTWTLTFTPVNGYEGELSFAVEYYEFSSNGIQRKYTTVNYVVKPTVVNASNDFYISTGSNQTLQVLSNDISQSSTDLSLDQITYVSGGTAEINGDDIIFTPDSNVERAYIQYLVTDEAGTGSHSIACLVSEGAYNGSVSKSMHNKTTMLLHMDYSNSVSLNTPNNGSLNQLHDLIWEYNPNNNFSGNETLDFEDPNGNQTSFSIEVYNKNINTGFIRDDYIYTPLNTSVQFNVTDNDLKDGISIYNHSTELVNLGGGSFEYTPATDFEGDEILSYTIFDGFSFSTGNIFIHVNDQAPVSSFEYSFDILKNENLELDYKVPFSTYYFEVATTPSNGSLTVLDATGQVQTNCDYITGDSKIIYTSNSGYSGTDQFDVEYSTDYGHSYIVKVNVNVSAQEADDCVCYNDCIWPGDTNADGIVNAKDYLYSYLYLGYSGDGRNETSSDWTSKSCDDWNFDIAKTNVDQKNIDSNGDGFISSEDSDVVSNNWNRINNLINEGSLILSDLPVTLSTTQTNIDSGEWLFLDINVGNNTHPALDFHGLGLTINVNPNLIDSSSVTLNIFNDSWAGNESPLNGMVHVPVDGVVDIGITTISDFGPSGEGIIGELGFIVEDDLEGWRLKESLLNMTILMNQAFVMNTNGEALRIADSKIEVAVNTTPNTIDPNDDFSLYPNPAVDQATISSKENSIESIEIYDIAGRHLDTQSFDGTHSANLNVNHLTEGLYLLKISAGDLIITKKLNKVSL